MTIEQITLSNVGPIKHLSFPCPGPGDIVVLQGRNGTGKSTALAHAEIAISGRGKGNISDGAATGQVDAFGITLKLGKSTRRSGTLEVEALEGKFNISDLIDPGYIDPKAADSCRIKAFAQIQKVLPSADLFYDLVGGQDQLEKLVRPASLQSDDFVQMAERIKADLNDAANREKGQAENAEGRATGAREAARGVDLSAESDPTVLQNALKTAIAAEEKLKAEAEAAIRAKRAMQEAQDQLADAEAEYSGPSLAQAQKAEETAKAEQAKADGPAKALADRLREAKHDQALTAQAKASTELEAKRARKTEDGCKNSVTSYQRDIEAMRRELARLEKGLADAEAELMTASLEAEELSAKAVAAVDADTKAASIVLDVQSQLADATRANELACQALANCIATRKQAEAHEAAMAAWRKQLAITAPPEPSAEELVKAAERVAECNAACEAGALIRKAREQIAAAEQHVKTAGEHRKRASELRDAAKGTDDVLSGIVARSGSQLRVEQGRLVLDTPKRGKTFFHELSAGERARIAIDIGVDAMPPGKPGVIIVSQEIWEGLDDLHRAAVKAHAECRGVGILTAEAGVQEEITPTAYEPATEAVA